MKQWSAKDELQQPVNTTVIQPETIRKAQLTVCANAVDSTDAEHLLNMLGLI